MNERSAGSPTVVVDANLAVWAVLPVLAPVDAIEIFADLRRRGIRVVAPMLWLAEGVSAIRACVHRRLIAIEEGRTAIESLLALEVETIPMSDGHCRSAFAWAERLGQVRAYDGFYLALAEELQAELWTADRGLANTARLSGATWVHGVGERV